MVHTPGNNGLHVLHEELEFVLDEATRLGAQFMMIGDFNARIGEENISIDDMIIALISEDKIFNYEGDYKGKYTFIGTLGASVIDYFIVKEDDPSMSLEILPRVESEHMPLAVKLDWTLDKGPPATYPKQLERLPSLESMESDSLIGTLSRCITGAATDAGLKMDSGYQISEHWFDKDCRREKRNVRRLLYKFRKSKTDDNRFMYTKAKKDLRVLYQMKKKSREDRIWNKISASKSTTEFWQEINKFRKKKNRRGQDILLYEWKEHFMTILDGSNELRVTANQHQVAEELIFGHHEFLDRLGILSCLCMWIKTDNADYMSYQSILSFLDADFDVAELKKATANLKVGKAPDLDGEERDTSNYREITLLNGLYKIMTAMMASRLQRWTEDENIITENQAGFCKSYGMRDNLFVLNALINNRTRNQKGKLYVCFIDFKAAFDKINRGRLMEKLWMVGIRGRMIKSIYSSTGNVVATDLDMSELFWTFDGVRQVIGKRKIFALKFADDIAAVAIDREGLAEMLVLLEKYTRKNFLTLNVQKNKIMVFRNGGRKAVRDKWSFAGHAIEVVNRYKYLGVWFTTKNSFGLHLDLMRGRAQKVVNATWSVTKRAGLRSIDSKIRLFQSLILPIVMYGVEVWGVRRWEAVEGVHRKYMKMALGLNSNTPDYLWELELGRNDLECTALKRIFGYVLHVLNMDESRWPKVCFKEMIKVECHPKFTWWRDFEVAVNTVGSAELITALRENDIDNVKLMMGSALVKKMEQGLQERWALCDCSSFCPFYQDIKHDILPAAYLRSSEVTVHMREAWTRLRCGNEHKKWLSAAEQRCRLCEGDIESLDHIFVHCPALVFPRSLSNKWSRWHQVLEGPVDVDLFDILFAFRFRCAAGRAEDI
uniref:Reverse transcriptase domain-containing protein n=1 Tax=Strigamia maritima TaxID=126957 RepID=T1IIN5_STRMM